MTDRMRVRKRGTWSQNDCLLSGLIIAGAAEPSTKIAALGKDRVWRRVNLLIE